MNELLHIYVELLKWDLSVMSQPWMFWCVLPIMVFLPFFLLKWAVITAPFWLPIGFIFAAARRK